MAIVRRESWGPAWICWVDSDPSGVTTAPQGSVALHVNGSAAWQNTDGGATWAALGGAAPVLPAFDLDALMATWTNTAGNYTNGMKFRVGAPQSMTGLRFKWTGAAKTIRCSLWNITGASRVTYIDVAVGAGPVVTDATFAAPQALSIGVDYAASTWDTSSALYQYATVPSPTALPGRPFFLPPGKIEILHIRVYAAGDAIPTTTGAQANPVTPLLA